MGFLYVFGLMFLTIFGAAMLVYPIISEVFKTAGKRYNSGTDGNSAKRNDKR